MALVALRPAHAPALARYFDALSDEARTFRFLRELVRVPLAAVRALCRPDGERHLAWVAVRGGAIVGECQLARAAGVGEAGRAEFALSVADAHRGEGIGRRLLGLLVAAAARHDVTTLTFAADARNTRMLAWMATRGARWSTRSGVVAGWLRLPAPAPRPVRAAAPWAAARRRWATTLRVRARRLA